MEGWPQVHFPKFVNHLWFCRGYFSRYLTWLESHPYGDSFSWFLHTPIPGIIQPNALSLLCCHCRFGVRHVFVPCWLWLHVLLRRWEHWSPLAHAFLAYWNRCWWHVCLVQLSRLDRLEKVGIWKSPWGPRSFWPSRNDYFPHQLSGFCLWCR